MFNFSPSAVWWPVVAAVVFVAVLVGLWATSTGSVWADAGGEASCIGIESSSVAPPGSSDEFSGGRAQAAHFLKDLSTDLGVPPGAIYSFVAKFHEGSHEACDEATE